LLPYCNLKQIATFHGIFMILIYLIQECHLVFNLQVVKVQVDFHFQNLNSMLLIPLFISYPHFLFLLTLHYLDLVTKAIIFHQKSSYVFDLDLIVNLQFMPFLIQSPFLCIRFVKFVVLVNPITQAILSFHHLLILNCQISLLILSQ